MHGTTDRNGMDYIEFIVVENRYLITNKSIYLENGGHNGKVIKNDMGTNQLESFTYNTLAKCGKA